MESKDIIVAESLSFITAFVPVTKIPDLAKYDLVYKIGDGALSRSIELDTARRTVHATSEELSRNGLVLNGSGVTVAIIDDGIDHPSLNDKVIERVGCNFNSCTAINLPDLASTHGIAVAQIIAASGLPARNGYAPGVDLLDIRTDRASSIAHALDWALTHGADISNHSYGIGYCMNNNHSSNLIINEAVDKGMVLVKSAGNRSGYTKISNPGCAYNVITAGGINDRVPNVITMFANSSRGPTDNDEPRLKPDVVAPAYSIQLLSDTVSNSTIPHDGTSFAAAQVSATTALLLQTKPDLTPVEIKAAILLGADWQGPIPCTSVQYEQNNANDNCSYARQPFGYDERNNAASLGILNNVGFGILNVNQTLEYTSKRTTDHTHVLGGYLDPIDSSKTYQFTVYDITEPVKVILSWLVHPHGSIIDQSSRVNYVNMADLGFVITPPSGNNIIRATSDYQSNEFAVFMPTQTGTYTITVNGTGLESITKPIQNYALASTLSLQPLPSTHTNIPPTAQDKTIIVNPLQRVDPVTVILSGADSDGDPVSFSVSRNPSHGITSTDEIITSKISRMFYTIQSSFTALDTFEITPQDGLVTGTPATITLKAETPPPHSIVPSRSDDIRHWDTVVVTSGLISDEYSQTFSGPIESVHALYVGSANMEGVTLNIITSTSDEYTVAVPSSGTRMLEFDSSITISSVILSADGIDEEAAHILNLTENTFSDASDIRMFVGYITDSCSLSPLASLCYLGTWITNTINLNVAIPDGTSTQSINEIITIPQSGTLESIDVSVDIEHPYIGDLHVYLVSPQEDQIVLHRETGGATDTSRQHIHQHPTQDLHP